MTDGNTATLHSCTHRYEIADSFLLSHNIVCHDSTLDDDLFKGMKKHNSFENAESNKNPHKSYGYLIQPKLSEKFKEFML